MRDWGTCCDEDRREESQVSVRSDSAADATPAAVSADASPHPSAMRARFGWLAELIANRMFGDVVINENAANKIRELAQTGTIVFTMRHRSFIDYFFVNHVLRREGLPLPVFANGVSTWPLAPVSDIFARLRTRIGQIFSGRGREAAESAHDTCAEAARQGRPVLIFMRGRRTRGGITGWLRPPSPTRVGSDFLREIVHARRGGDREYFVIPLAPFRGRSFRKREKGISALVYSVHEVPSDTRKLVTYWWNRKDLFITVGKEVSLGEFMQRFASDTEERIVRRLTRALQIFLHREERVVLGPALLPRRQIKALVLENDEITSTMRRLSEQTGVPLTKLRKEADGYFEELAADFNGFLFAIVAYIFKKIWARMFSGIVPIGFDEVVNKVRHHPVVLVPCHRSHFDYLILSYLFHLNFVSPPHIFAGVNMAFWPLAPFLRGAGAYFVRRTFADNELYKQVFKQYLSFLIREGYTQEFFIEGGRSRTGKMMTPKLGMLSALVGAYLGGVRSDLYLVPVSIHYGRILEEDAFQFELRGGAKEAESFAGLLRARRFLRQRFGTVYLSFAKPISLRDTLGDRRSRFSEGVNDSAVEEEKRRFVQKLGFKILRDVNDCSVAGATSISATVLLSGPHRGTRYEDYARLANALARLIKAQGVKTTASLDRNIGDFRESLDFLAKSGLIDRIRRGSDEIVVVRENKRLALDFYKNNVIHAFVLPSLVCSALLEQKRGDALIEEVQRWLDVFRYEFALPDRHELGRHIETAIARLRDLDALRADEIDPTNPVVIATVGVLDVFREAYWLSVKTVREVLTAEGSTDKSLVSEYQKAYEAALLVGEVVQPEGATTVLFHNTVSRLVELGYVRTERRGRGGRERVHLRGSRWADLGTYEEDLRRALLKGRSIWPRPL
jgi:glycerol-3-phosphate O-acyltransferase